MPTFTIPLTTLQPGTREFGPATAQNGDTSVRLSVDRTVAGGLNSLAADTTVKAELQASTDGGVTWHAVDTDQPESSTFWIAQGGVYTWTDKQGVLQTINESTGRWPLFPGTGRRAKAVITVSGSAVAVAGTLTTS